VWITKKTCEVKKKKKKAKKVDSLREGQTNKKNWLKTNEFKNKIKSNFLLQVFFSKKNFQSLSV